MSQTAPQSIKDYGTIIYPALMLLVFFAIPFGIMIAVSFFQRDPAGFYSVDFVWSNYERFISTFFAKILGFSVGLAVLVSLICTAISFPFTFLLTRLSRPAQVIWLVGILSVLSLSEVIIGFSWSSLFSRTAGLSNILVSLGIMDKAVSLYPSFGAVLTAMVYQALPYTILVLYPSLARFDLSYIEAAKTMGASPLRAFINVMIPIQRNTIVATLIMVFVFALGSYLLPQILGRPSHWTLSVLITDQAIYQSNMPFAAAMAVFLVLISLALIGLTLLVGKEEGAEK